MDKVVNSLREAIRLCGLEDGMTISFHHCLRGGDAVSVQIAEAIRSLGIRDSDRGALQPDQRQRRALRGLYRGMAPSPEFQTSGFSPALGRLLQSGPDSARSASCGPTAAARRR